MSLPSNPLTIAPHVAATLALSQPVVALESTVITHGLPWPKNLEVARTMEAAIRDSGATPATIAVLDGQLRVGVTDTELEMLAQVGGQARKVSRRDLPIAVARGEHGGTTVAATMWVAHRAGIQVFATGGIGGVHRRHPWDVSADLPELAQTPVLVACSGAKAILDLPLTLEWLETHGVPVLGWQTDTFPAFYSRDSGLPIDQRVANAAEVAIIWRAQRALGLGGALLAVPIPAEYATPPAVAEKAVAVALDEADARGIRGKAVTPFLLERVAAITEGASQAANLALLEHNARVAAQVAVALAHAPS
ncbi:MAG: pseudouridine-5'-phosphate glycosidase [Anaerolineae bacterium]|nr:pseudouridine-5'-phosphate glycosidase [Anaerolineae bacterium]